MSVFPYWKKLGYACEITPNSGHFYMWDKFKGVYFFLTAFAFWLLQLVHSKTCPHGQKCDTSLTLASAWNGSCWLKFSIVSLLSMLVFVSVWVYSGLVCSGLSGLVCSGLVSGLICSRLVWASLVWSGLKFISVFAAYSKITKSRIHHPHHPLHFFPWPRYNYIELKFWPYIWH